MIPKFKFWDKDEQYFIKDATIVLNQDGSVEGLEYYHSKLKYLVYNDISYYELIQSTGLKDKNGVEVFEGDIIDCYTEGLSTVKFEHGCFGLVCNGYFEGFENVLGKLEIIGNQFEHPHLLEE
ncbi:YopX family protein [Staphylococcus carnosus]|uniref:YopX family protein n=1 Tax=Staphylococcus carnosus TaxID=1281 RepID=UPI00081A3F0F|nr:YopX family protein [Staphylococcus carnosus]ANZ33890.1 hypothetical protein BEK99_08865 [Staphylococcus carnosus]UTB86071.1 hypothetical protein A2I66_10465 [Staphylococcus carnosus]